ncbi:MAG: hypothetical protein FJ297_13180 [Planctomycetes bacterium]|nr:hypothetical protein [Planctomycetota bacterium]
MARGLALLAVLFTASCLVGCGSKASGPMDPKDVKAADSAEVKKGMDDSAKHLPPGVKMPKGAVPGK